MDEKMTELLTQIIRFAEQETREAQEWMDDYDRTHERGSKSRAYFERAGYSDGISSMMEMIEQTCLMNDIELPEVD